MVGAQLLTVRYREGRPYAADPSQMVTLVKCRGEFWRPISKSLREFPRGAFDYVWLVQPPPYDPALTRGMQPIWRSGTSVLYRVVDRSPPEG
jgi:hypothetical protein